MKFSKETPTGNFVIQGQTFNIPRPFSEAHVCTVAEAGVLNQTLAENIRNSFNLKVKEHVDAETLDVNKMQADIDEYLEQYEFGVRRGRGPVDPVERETLNMAKDIVRAALREKGYKIADIDTEEITRLAEDVITQNPDVAKEAKRRVNERAKLRVGEIGAVQTKPSEED